MRKPISIQAASRKEPAAIFAFDLLELEGQDLRARPLLERKARIKDVLSGAKRIRYVEHVEDGLGLVAAAEEAELEGIVAKRWRLTVEARPATGSKSKRAPAERSWSSDESGTSVSSSSRAPLDWRFTS
jgi:ATP-dependent DNA ligase